jgi:hypothetical protein
MIVTPEANSPRERLSVVVGDLAVLFASSVKCTASFVCCREMSMEFLEMRRTKGLTSQRTAIGMSRLKAIASTSTSLAMIEAQRTLLRAKSEVPLEPIVQLLHSDRFSTSAKFSSAC